MEANKFKGNRIKQYLAVGWTDLFYFYTISEKKSVRLLYQKLKKFTTYNIPSMLADIWYSFGSSNRKTPDFLVIGVHKGGTTSIYEYLKQHPEISMSRRKEINFFSKYYFMGLNYYKSFFPKTSSKKITGEVSPYYLFHPLVAQRVKALNPNIKIIALLRDPVNRAHSHYNMIKHLDPAKSFQHAISLEKERIKGEKERLLTNPFYHSVVYQSFSYLHTGLYHDQLLEWSKYFDLSEMLILKSEDLFGNTKETLKKVYDYLDVSEVYPEDLQAKNARSYQKLPEDTYKQYAPFFEEDQTKLKELLNGHSMISKV